MSIYDRPISEHGGAKYLRTIHPADGQGQPIKIDVYAVIRAYNVTCPAMQQALKKLLACGQRGKGSVLDDIHGVFDAMWRARELAIQDAKRDNTTATDSRKAVPIYISAEGPTSIIMTDGLPICYVCSGCQKTLKSSKPCVDCFPAGD